MKRRIISIGLAFLTVIGLFLLSACGNDEMFSETFIQDQELENEVKGAVLAGEEADKQ